MLEMKFRFLSSAAGQPVHKPMAGACISVSHQSVAFSMAQVATFEYCDCLAS